MLTAKLHSKSPAADLLPSNEIIEQIARRTKLVQRRSAKFSATEFLAVLLMAVIDGKSTLRNMCVRFDFLGRPCMSRQGMHQRFHRHTVGFLIAVLYEVLGMRSGFDRERVTTLGFTRLIVEDSTQFQSNSGNRDFLEGHSNQHVETSGCKVTLSFDLVSGEPLNIALHAGTVPDQEIGKDLIVMLKRGDLVVRDMGYFWIEGFELIEARGADWASRLPSNVKVLAAENGRNLEEVLNSSKAAVVDLACALGAKDRHNCRLVAFRADKETFEKARRERRKRDRQSGRQSSMEEQARDEWHLMVTSLKPDRVGAQELFAIYRLRWSIETVFKSWKQSTALEKAIGRKSNEDFILSLLYASMIGLALTLRVKIAYQAVERLSMQKLFDAFSDWLKFYLARAQVRVFDPDPRHIKKDKEIRATDSLREMSIDEIYDAVTALALA